MTRTPRGVSAREFVHVLEADGFPWAWAAVPI